VGGEHALVTVANAIAKAAKIAAFVTRKLTRTPINVGPGKAPASRAEMEAFEVKLFGTPG